MSTSGNQRATAKVDRKRITDRRAQRNHRERVKAYISHLETTVEELTKASQKGSEQSLLQKLQEKQLEIEQIKRAIRQANEALRTALGAASSISPAIAETVHKDSPEIASQDKTAQGLNDRKIQLESIFEERDISPSTSRGSQFHNDHRIKTLHSPYGNLACGDGQVNYFQVVNESIVHVLSAGPLTTSADDDDDLAIRAILHGWNAVKENRPLDHGWNFLRALDQGLFHRTGPVERLAILRLMRSMLMSKRGSPEHSTGQIPSFMFPTYVPAILRQYEAKAVCNISTMQTLVAHACIVDFFVWPNLRDHLIASETSHTPEAAAAHYATEIQLSWPYLVRDAFKYNEEKGKFQFSVEFNNVYYDLKSWQFRSNPALKMLVANGPMSSLEGRLQASTSVLMSPLDPNGFIEAGAVAGY
ncbi:hypothetical protein ANOM_008040 [Aspergillus nomiae NRRL 13137]|uniref:BZIP transcription factor n=1 Tax=Aspergillus nomiae NRRL (strain ATCC 15546 / NRRL 13137 / CBS 260.88 / M93) TaxID=1509407 RepID=A0A0L1IWB6_ASPN3|nr:uncharacterized protein ANOM_008040 [Aspergillus nomiae NRRL 13137]KNG83448.1 hypothetical protein ANOM_008040 [Aspergillus nomiae NRRL 13137]